jgi:glutamate 5-kinase
MIPKQAKRIVIKIGTNVLTDNLCGLNVAILQDIASQMADVKRQKKQVLIVTSGAIGAGCLELQMKKSRDIETRQALAAVGQSAVMRHYYDAFSKHKINVAQILLTYEDFSNRKRYLNLKQSIDKLLALGVIPIINENDPISVDEIDATFGDNDKLSALVASKVDADLLIMLSDIDGLYDKNPKTNKDAKLIRLVTGITKDIEKAAGKSGSAFAVGGMVTKIKAARIALDAGCNMLICNGKKKDIIAKALAEDEGTLFVSKRFLSNKQRWIKHSRSKGKLIINRKAHDIISKGEASLLAVGIDKVVGKFDKNDVVDVNDIAKGIVDRSSSEIDEMIGIKGKIVIKNENLVLI